MICVPDREASISVTAGSGAHSTSMASSASSACARVCATTAAMASPINRDGVLRGRLDALQVAEHGDLRFAVLRQRRAIDCRDHTGQRARLGEIKPDDARVRVRTAKEHHMGAPGKSQIIGIGSAPLQQTLGVGTRDASPCVWRVHQRLLRAASTVSTASTIA